MDQDLTAAELWADIIAAHKLDEPPEGAMCVIEFAEKVGKSEKHARDILKKLEAEGELESDEFVRPQDRKRARYYWPVKK